MFLPGTSSRLACRVDGASVPVPLFITARMQLACAYARAVARCTLEAHLASRLGSDGPLPPAMAWLKNWTSQSINVLCKAWTSMVSTRRRHLCFWPGPPSHGALLPTLRISCCSVFFSSVPASSPPPTSRDGQGGLVPSAARLSPCRDGRRVGVENGSGFLAFGT
jgi:hypothetical protein